VDSANNRVEEFTKQSDGSYAYAMEMDNMDTSGQPYGGGTWQYPPDPDGIAIGPGSVTVSTTTSTGGKPYISQ